MNFLPTEIEDIILDNKYQIEHKENLSRCLDELKQIKIKHTESDTFITYSNGREVQYYGGWNLDNTGKGNDELWVHNYKNDDVNMNNMDNEIVRIYIYNVFEGYDYIQC